MPQSLARLHIHLIFSTKERVSVLNNGVRPALHAYLAGALQKLDCPPVLINSTDDHIHLLFELARTRSISEVVEEVKKFSSKWIKTQGPTFSQFAWQAGYGAFAVSESNVISVRDYISNQKEHHRKISFQDEYRTFLTRHNLTYDERYVWD